MRIYIIGNDGITLCREAPASVTDGEIAVVSNQELHAAPLSGKRLLGLWNALPGVEKRQKVGDRGALIAIAGGETCQFGRTTGPSKATPRTMAVAVAIACQATVRRKAGSVQRVTRANGRMAFSGPRGRKKRMPMSP
jgi:hypothetical protein